MNNKSFEISSLFVASIIIIVSFVYAINIQPVVFGTDTTLLPSNDDNRSYDLMSFKSYEEFFSFLKNSSIFNYNYDTSQELLLKNNIEIMEDSEFTFQGEYIYKLSLENDFEYQGRIMHREHEESTQGNEYYYWYGWSPYYVERSLFINDLLYTISDKLIKMNDLGDLNEINSIKLE